MLFDELMEAIVQLVVLLGKLAELLVALQQEILHFLRVCCVHNAALLYRERLVSSSTTGKVSQGRPDAQWVMLSRKPRLADPQDHHATGSTRLQLDWCSSSGGCPQRRSPDAHTGAARRCCPRALRASRVSRRAASLRRARGASTPFRTRVPGTVDAARCC